MTEEKPSRIYFPKIKGPLVNLRELSINDAVDISRLMTPQYFQIFMAGSLSLYCKNAVDTLSIHVIEISSH